MNKINNKDVYKDFCRSKTYGLKSIIGIFFVCMFSIIILTFGVSTHSSFDNSAKNNLNAVTTGTASLTLTYDKNRSDENIDKYKNSELVFILYDINNTIVAGEVFDTAIKENDSTIVFSNLNSNSQYTLKVLAPSFGEFVLKNEDKRSIKSNLVKLQMTNDLNFIFTYNQTQETIFSGTTVL